MSVTSTPAMAHTPRDDESCLTDEERDLLSSAMSDAKWPPERRMQMVAFLRDVEWDEDAAAQRACAFEKEVLQRTTPLFADVRAHIGMEEISDGTFLPKPCGVLLEDGRGGCARDRDGNPIVVIYGNFECSTEDAITQMVFLMHRVQRYVDVRDVPKCTYVFDMGPRAGRHTVGGPLNLSFIRFSGLFPQSFRVYICATPPAAAKAFNMMPSSVMSNVTVSDSYAPLEAVIAPENMLPSWHPSGTFDFDLERYTAYLSSE